MPTNGGSRTTTAVELKHALRSSNSSSNNNNSNNNSSNDSAERENYTAGAGDVAIESTHGTVTIESVEFDNGKVDGVDVSALATRVSKLECPRGMEYDSTAKRCEKCVPGFWNNERGRSLCKPVTSGLTCPVGAGLVRNSIILNQTGPDDLISAVIIPDPSSFGIRNRFRMSHT